MRSYVVEENIRRFQAMLATEASPERRAMLQTLLHEEEAKLADLKTAGASAGGGDGQGG